jgi:hypothetical protein
MVLNPFFGLGMAGIVLWLLIVRHRKKHRR